jgi:two-component system nitrate/nitrite response regulator NarL
MLNGPITSATPVRIVVAAAEDTFRASLRKQLEREARFQVVGEAPDSRVARRLISRLAPDLVVIECELNREFVADKSESRPATIVLVASTDPQPIVEAFELGARGVVLKAVLPPEWGPGIERVVAGQYWFADESIPILLRAARQSLLQPETAQLHDFGLTPRETEIAQKIAAGRSNKELSKEFSIRERTVKHHLTNIFRKVGVSSRLELALRVRDSVRFRQAIPRPLSAHAVRESNAV